MIMHLPILIVHECIDRQTILLHQYSIMHMLHTRAVTKQHNTPVHTYTVNLKKGGSISVFITLENLDGY